MTPAARSLPRGRARSGGRAITRFCPRCGDEFEDGVLRCPDHDVELLAEGEAPPPPDADALLGTFHPAVADVLVDTLQRRHVPFERFDFDDGVELLVAEEHRGDLRAELVVNWTDLIGRVAEEHRAEVRALGGTSPGWFDAPSSAWVDRDGRLQVSEAPEDEHLQDASRTLGPALVVGGLAALLMAWYLGGEVRTPLLLVGLGSIGFGVFVPR